MVEYGTARSAPSYWDWFAGSAFVLGVGTVVGVTMWGDSRGPPKQKDVSPPGKDPGPGLEVPGLPPAGIKSAGYPGASSPTHQGVYEQMPAGDGYVLRRPANAWGTPETVQSMRDAIDRWNELAPDFGGDVYTISIGDISKKGGGRLPPHKSHHQGRDVDVNFAIASGEPRDNKLTTLPLIPLLIAFLNDDNTKAIYLDWGRQRDVWEALELNPDLPFADMLKAELQYPLRAHSGRTRIRHWDGHERHIHVRYRA